jgi:hypothetical protein
MVDGCLPLIFPACVFVYLSVCWDLVDHLLCRMAFPQLPPAVFVLIGVSV